MNSDDICLWPDGTWCYWNEIGDYSYMSDDYEVIAEGTSKYDQFLMEIY